MSVTGRGILPHLKRRKRRKKDRASELCLHRFKAGLQCVAWAVSAYPRPISSNMGDSILTRFESHPA